MKTHCIVVMKPIASDRGVDTAVGDIDSMLCLAAVALIVLQSRLSEKSVKMPQVALVA